MQEVQLYYRRYRRYSCNTTNAANASVPNFGTERAVFKCMSPIDVLCRNESKCRRYSCTTGGTRDAAVLQEVQEAQLYLDLVQEQQYSCVWAP